MKNGLRAPTRTLYRLALLPSKVFCMQRLRVSSVFLTTGCGIVAPFNYSLILKDQRSQPSTAAFHLNRSHTSAQAGTGTPTFTVCGQFHHFYLAVFSTWNGRCGSDWPLDEIFLREPRACAISQKDADHPLARRIQHVLFSRTTFMSFPCVRVWVSPCACVSLRASALVPDLAHLLLLLLRCLEDPLIGCSAAPFV